MATTTRVWDLPTRLFHWSLTACVAGLAVTGYIGGGTMSWHARIGYAVLTLLLFRLLWGVVGGHWSRFSSFVYSPRSMVAYLRGQAHPESGATAGGDRVKKSYQAVAAKHRCRNRQTNSRPKTPGS